MRKNSIRKFVHAVLDLIPLFVIPIFAIYTRNENYNSNIEITVNESYWENSIKFESNEVNNLQDLVEGNIYYAEQFTLINDNFSFELDFYYIDSLEFNTVNYNEIDEKVIEGYDCNNNNYLHVTFDNNSTTLLFTNNNCYLSNYYEDPFSFTFFDCHFVITYGLSDFKSYLQANDYDLPQQSDFKVYEHIYHENTPVVYNDTDVGSQFVYTLYNATDKYFNMNNVFNMKDVYDWFVLNIFGGNAPLGLYIVWNIVLYEFVMDLLMLLYGVFMFFIDCCTKLIEKPLNAIK